MSKLDDVQKKIAALEAESKKLAAILEVYPDLKEHVGRWNTRRYHSDLALKDTTNMDYSCSCGCCPDVGMSARPFLKVNGETIYGGKDGALLQIEIGERDYDWNTYFHADWRERLVAGGVPAVAIESIAKYETLRDDE